jgi:hypothetical protein
MLYSWIDAAIASAIAVAAVAAAFALDAWQLRHRRRARARQRAVGAGPYKPTHDFPRDVDLALAIADHLRLKFGPIVRLGLAINEAMRVSLRAATLVAPIHPDR